MQYSQEFLEKTRKVWQPYSKEKLTLEDAREITDNLTGFFKILMEWDKKYGDQIREEEKNASAHSS